MLMAFPALHDCRDLGKVVSQAYRERQRHSLEVMEGIRSYPQAIRLELCEI